MRVFERLRGRTRKGTNIERKLFETIADGLLRSLENGTAAPGLAEPEDTCGPCCSAKEPAHR